MRYERIRPGDQFVDHRYGDIVTVVDRTSTDVTVETQRGVEVSLGVSPVELIWRNEFQRYVLE